MSTPAVHTQWQLLDCDGDASQPDIDTISFSLQANGKAYCVAVSAPKKASSQEFAQAMQAAAGFYIRGAGGDMTRVGAQELSDAKMDTGDQRAS